MVTTLCAGDLPEQVSAFFRKFQEAAVEPLEQRWAQLNEEQREVVKKQPGALLSE